MNPLSPRTVLSLVFCIAASIPNSLILSAAPPSSSDGQLVVPIDKCSLGYISTVAVVDGHSLRLIIDTGAPQSRLDQRKTHKLQLPWQNLRPNDDSVMCCNLKSIKLGATEIGQAAVLSHDLSRINALLSEAGDKEVDGILGSDFLSDNKALIDYGNLQLHLTPKWQQRTPFQLPRLHRDVPRDE